MTLYIGSMGSLLFLQRKGVWYRERESHCTDQLLEMIQVHPTHKVPLGWWSQQTTGHTSQRVCWTLGTGTAARETGDQTVIAEWSEPNLVVSMGWIFYIVWVISYIPQKMLSLHPSTLMTYSRNYGVLTGHNFVLTTHHSPGLLHIVFQEAVVEHASVMNVHIPFLICDQNTDYVILKLHVHNLCVYIPGTCTSMQK